MASGYSDLSEIRKSGNAYGTYPKPPKINLINEEPRRESVIEQQLRSTIIRPVFSHQSNNQQQVDHREQQVFTNRSQGNSQNFGIKNNSYSSTTSNAANVWNNPVPSGSGFRSMNVVQQPSSRTINTTIVKTSSNSDGRLTYESLESDLAAKEAKLKKEMAYLNQYQNPWSRPMQIREPRREHSGGVIRRDPKWIRECPSSPSSRPTSRASSTRSTTEADLLEKAAQLLKDVEELERKPLNKQQILIETGGRIRQQENPSNYGQNVNSVQTAVIKVPSGEINNKSPLPFAFDNFSTLGVRGNIASFGAAEPDTPYPPIFPTIKRTPSPANRRA